MNWLHRDACRPLVLLLALLGGCHAGVEYLRDEAVSHYRDVATTITYPDVHQASLREVTETLPPHTVTDPAAKEIWDLTLPEAIRIALSHSKVLEDLGGRVVRNPDGTPTIYDPAIRESDPRFGVEGALAAFDANLAMGITWARTDRPFNNAIQAGAVLPQVFLFNEDSASFNAEISKTTAGGARLAARKTIDYRLNNSPNNFFPSAFTNALEFEFRQPLLQGSGVEFNRIAGPQATPGFFFSNGVLIARINTDIAIADFEAAVRDLVSQVEDTYWELYFAYRDLGAQVAARNSALQTWREVKAKFDTGSASAGEEAQARQQLFQFEAAVTATLGGTAAFVTITSSRGGLYGVEANLRRLMGLAVNDGRLIRPADEPMLAPLVPDWYVDVAEALAMRVELRQQKWRIKRRELELRAAKNFLLPRLDLTALYRLNGMGDRLTASDSDNARFQNTMETLTSGDFSDWQWSMELQLPIGFRQALAGVRNAELQLARARDVLKRMELGVTHDLGRAVRALDSAYRQAQINFNGRRAAEQRVQVQRVLYEQGVLTLDDLLRAQEQLARAESEYYRSLVEYNLALKQLQFEKGTLLAYNNIHLAEGPWPDKAYENAYQRGREWSHARRVDIGITEPAPFVEHAMPAQPVPASDGQVSAPVPEAAMPAKEDVPSLMQSGQ